MTLWYGAAFLCQNSEYNIKTRPNVTIFSKGGKVYPYILSNPLKSLTVEKVVLEWLIQIKMNLLSLDL